MKPCGCVIKTDHGDWCPGAGCYGNLKCKQIISYCALHERAEEMLAFLKFINKKWPLLKKDGEMVERLIAKASQPTNDK